MKANSLSVGYQEQLILKDLNVTLPKGKITVFLGSNGCGKSTLLRTLARLLKPQGGNVVLDGQDISKQKTKDIAKQLAILPQGPVTPEGLTVLQLVKQGRYPYQNWFKQWSEEDEKAVQKALESTRMTELQDRAVDSLSGGQRQRAWIAMTLAQDTDIILLDEPTTYLDMTHQIEILDLLFELNETEGRTIIMVLHDLNLACRYAHHIVAIRDGCVYAEGEPEEVISPAMVHEVFNMTCQVACDPLFGTPMCIPHGKGRCLQRIQQQEGAQNEREMSYSS
ncbi:iron complex transport system ATP-binding protein [Aureibacillus halotolerans]|uniref:Iron complex transport system ATP-binding protein n=2 Tax=Aureibacillus halotolerans TaxID=1508390 RepID=A0A4R6TUS0_9BACI|nr:iron complex transport system ATP-binding protein [Aureibacillus halotolerans]